MGGWVLFFTQSIMSLVINVEGNIASGKTTFLERIGEEVEAIIITEPVDKWRNVRGVNLLEAFYNDPARHVFPFQVYATYTMLQNHLIANPQCPIKLMERSIYSSQCFVECLFREKHINQLEKNILDECRDGAVAQFQRHVTPDIIIYLQSNPEVVYQRILERGRAEEASISLDYLQQLHEIHEDWLINKRLFQLPTSVIITLNANNSIDDMLKELKSYSLY